MAQNDFKTKRAILAFTHYMLYFTRLTLGANDGSRTHDLPITNRWSDCRNGGVDFSRTGQGPQDPNQSLARTAGTKRQN